MFTICFFVLGWLVWIGIQSPNSNLATTFTGFDGNIVDMSSWGNETVFVNDLLAEELVDAKI